MMNRPWLKRGWMALAFALAMLIAPAAVRAGDKVHLKDGTVLEGTITREEQGYVWIKVSYGTLTREKLVTPAEIARIEREGDAGAPAPEKARPASDGKPASAAPQARKSGVPRVAMLSLGEPPDKEMVGLFITAEQLRQAIPLLEQEGVTDVVFKINSGGGLALEMPRLSDVIHNEYKPKFRTVAWIEAAISAAAMTAHCIEEIYFMPQGNYGACTMWSGQLKGAEGRPLEEVLFEMEKISARGQYDSKIMRSMQIMEPLSYTIDSNGDVHWYQDLSGEHIANPDGQILTFNAQSATQCKFAKGIAATKEELVKLMGYQEVEWVGKSKTGVSWPISRAEESIARFRDKTFEDQQRLNEYFTSYQTAVQRASSMQDRRDRAKFVGLATRHLDRIEDMVRNNENMALMIGFLPSQFKEWVEEQRKILRDLMR